MITGWPSGDPVLEEPMLIDGDKRLKIEVDKSFDIPYRTESNILNDAELH